MLADQLVDQFAVSIDSSTSSSSGDISRLLVLMEKIGPLIGPLKY